MSPNESLSEAVKSLWPDEQTSVLQFIEYLRGRKDGSTFLQAADQFISEHPKLLKRLAQ